MNVSTRTLAIAFVAVAAVGIGWFASRPLSAQRSGMPAGWPSKKVTEVVSDFLTKSSVASWNIDSTQVYDRDQDATRISELRDTLNELSQHGKLKGVKGFTDSNRSFEEVKGGGGILYRWTGTANFEGGEVPIKAEVIQTPPDFKIGRITIVTEDDQEASAAAEAFFRQAVAKKWDAKALADKIYQVDGDEKRIARIQTALSEFTRVPGFELIELVSGDSKRGPIKEGPSGKSLTWTGKVAAQSMYMRLTIEFVEVDGELKVKEITPG